MKKLFLALPIVLAACASTESQQLLTACEAHDAAIRALAPQVAAGRFSQGQVSAVDQSIVTADSVCDGTVREYRTALSVLEAELLRMTIIGAE